MKFIVQPHIEVCRIELPSSQLREHEGIVATKGVIPNSQLGRPSLQAEEKVPKYCGHQLLLIGCGR